MNIQQSRYSGNEYGCHITKIKNLGSNAYLIHARCETDEGGRRSWLENFVFQIISEQLIVADANYHHGHGSEWDE
jgi:hypothetical protein